jgi:hypothetical protein
MSATITVDGILLVELPGVIWDNSHPPTSGHFYLPPDAADVHVKVLSLVKSYGRRNEPSCRVVTTEGIEAEIRIRDAHAKDATTVFFDVKNWLKVP